MCLQLNLYLFHTNHGFRRLYDCGNSGEDVNQIFLLAHDDSVYDADSFVINYTFG